MGYSTRQRNVRVPSAFVIGRDELAVGSSGQWRGNSDRDVGRIGLVRGIVFARPPLARSERQTVVRDRGLSVALREGEALAFRSAVISHGDRERFAFGGDSFTATRIRSSSCRKVRGLAVESTASTVRARDEIECELRRRARQELRADFDDAAQGLRCRIDSQVQAVVLHIHRARGSWSAAMQSQTRA